MKIDVCIIVGCGGTGSHLIEPLARLLGYHKSGTQRIVLIDGDAYEEKNMERQLFDRAYLGHNKAQVMCERINFMTEVEMVTSYVDGERFQEILDEHTEPNDNVLVVTSVDNDRTRHEIIEVLADRRNLILISPGNKLSSGHAMLWMRQDGEDKSIHPYKRYANLEKPDDQIPGHGTCQREQGENPQLITANAYAAVCSLNLVQNILDDGEVYDEIFFSSEKMKFKRGEKVEIGVGAGA